MTTRHTTHFKLPVPDFTQTPWHAAMQSMIRSVDNLVFRALTAMNVTDWANATDYNIGNIMIDPDLGSLWLCRVTHTSRTSGTFATDRAAHPTYWTSFAVTFNPQGQWLNNTVYSYYDLVFDQDTGVMALCNTAHTSSASPAVFNDDVANWDVLANFVQQNAAEAISFSGTASDLDATDVQAAIDELFTVFAPKIDAALTGEPTAPTPLEADDTTALATTHFVTRALTTQAAALFPTGTALLSLNTTAASGWIIADDGTIGNATSGGTTRANADTANLYALLWTNISNTYAAVSTGRGASAAADFAAGKTIAIPKMLGRALAIAGAGSGLTSQAQGKTVGEESHTPTLAEMFAHSHGTTESAHTHTALNGTIANFNGTIASIFSGGSSGGGTALSSNATGLTVNSAGSSTAFNVQQPTSFAFKVHIKL
jgi:microcystin-dependent protein